jgi:hypothetical protein
LGKIIQWPLTGLLPQSVCGCKAGYEDVNDAEHLCQNLKLLLIGSEMISERGAALTSRLQSFETELVARDKNLAVWKPSAVD